MRIKVTGDKEYGYEVEYKATGKCREYLQVPPDGLEEALAGLAEEYVED